MGGRSTLSPMEQKSLIPWGAEPGCSLSLGRESKLGPSSWTRGWQWAHRASFSQSSHCSPGLSVCLWPLCWTPLVWKLTSFSTWILQVSLFLLLALLLFEHWVLWTSFLTSYLFIPTFHLFLFALLTGRFLNFIFQHSTEFSPTANMFIVSKTSFCSL